MENILFLLTVIPLSNSLFYKTTTDPFGDTGCSLKYPEGWCWSYCSGNSGDWCYTAKNCTNDEICSEELSCQAYSCQTADPGCVHYCPRVIPIPAGEQIQNPLGSTGCSKKYSGGWCWRYCEGNSGDWCYTSGSCLGNEEQCADKAKCSGYTCEKAVEGCVHYCPAPITEPPTTPNYTGIPPPVTIQIENRSTPEDNSHAALLTGILIGVAVLVVLTSLLTYRTCQGKKYAVMTRLEVQEYLKGRELALENGHESCLTEVGKLPLENMKFPNEYEIPRKNILLLNLLGKGNFGLVYNAKLTLDDNRTVSAAVKMPQSDCSKESFKSMLSEIKVLCYVGNHPNILGFLGVHIRDIGKGELLIATELCENGCLQDYLRDLESDQLAPCDLRDLHRFCHEISLGMEYIASKNIVHGDLATRNVLLNSDLSCKVGDFGLSRKLYEYQQYVKESREPLPWRWLALESLKKMEFTTKSDVWSFGVTTWEIYSLGCIPYPDRAWNEDFVSVLESGFRLSAPKHASEMIYAKMITTWNPNPEARPSFTELSSFLQTVRDVDYINLT